MKKYWFYFLVIAAGINCNSISSEKIEITLNQKGSKGQIIIWDLEDNAKIELNLKNSGPIKSAVWFLSSGNCSQRSASIQKLPEIKIDLTGELVSKGIIYFRDEETVSFNSITDGEHIIILTINDDEICLSIPKRNQK